MRPVRAFPPAAAFSMAIRSSCAWLGLGLGLGLRLGIGLGLDPIELCLFVELMRDPLGQLMRRVLHLVRGDMGEIWERYWADVAKILGRCGRRYRELGVPSANSCTLPLIL